MRWSFFKNEYFLHYFLWLNISTLPQILYFSFLYNSPYWYLQNHQEEKSLKALKQIRGKLCDVRGEFEKLKVSIGERNLWVGWRVLSSCYVFFFQKWRSRWRWRSRSGFNEDIQRTLLSQTIHYSQHSLPLDDIFWQVCHRNVCSRYIGENKNLAGAV